MKFNHLNVPTHWRNYWTRYPEGHTILEALISWVSQVDSMVDNQNKLNDNVEQFRNEIDDFVGRFDDRLQDEVTQTLKDWQVSGFLDVVINAALQWELDEYKATNEQNLLSINQQLAQTDGRIDTILVDGTPTEGNTTLLDGAVSASGENLGTVGTNIRKTQTGEAILDGALTREKLSADTLRTTDLLNHRNLFKNPTINTRDEWDFIGQEYAIDQSNGTLLSNAVKVSSSTADETYFLQDIPSNRLSDGEYDLHFFIKNTGVPVTVRIGVIGYPTPAINSGTVVHYEDRPISTGSAFNKITTSFTLTGSQTFNHLRVYIMVRTAGGSVYIAEPYLARQNPINTSYSYVMDGMRKLENLEQNVNPLAGKTMYYDGDSIAFGAGSGGKGFGDILAERNDMTLTKKAVSGATLAVFQPETRHNIVTSVLNNFNQPFDYALLEGGYNDFGNKLELGSVSNNPDVPYTTNPDTATVIGSLEKMFQHIQKNFPKTKIYFLLTHKVNRAFTQPLSVSNLTQTDVYNAIRIVCERYSVEVIDVFSKSGFNTYFAEHKKFTQNSDGIHPTLEGYETFYMPLIERQMK